jgi:hypothetical protein
MGHSLFPFRHDITLENFEEAVILSLLREMAAPAAVNVTQKPSGVKEI